MKIVLNDLYDYDLKIYQDEDLFKFSLDSVLLAEFVKFKSNDKIIDLCSGNGVVPLILYGKGISSIGVEIQENVAKLANDSFEYNKVNLKVLNADVKNVKKTFDSESFDIVTCNPPYFKVLENSKVNENYGKAIARHEIELTLEELIISTKYLLKNKGSFYLVHRPERLDDIIILLKSFGFSIKYVQFIYSDLFSNANMVIIEAIKNGNTSIKVNKPVIAGRLDTYKDIFS